MKFIVFILIIISFLNISISYATESFDANEFLSEIKEYSSEIFPEFSDENWLSGVLTRRYKHKWRRYFKKNCKYISERI